jgi:transcriptional regulator with XRE-family HTH domain
MQQSVTERVATAIRVEAARRNLSQTAVGEILGLTRFAMSRRMTGVQKFTIVELDRIAQAWDIPLATLLPDAEREVSAA